MKSNSSFQFSIRGQLDLLRFLLHQIHHQNDCGCYNKILPEKHNGFFGVLAGSLMSITIITMLIVAVALN